MSEYLFRGKNICVTGGLGSIGSEIIKGLLKFCPNKIIVLDNRETEMFYSKMYSPSPIIKYEVADIRSYDSIEPLFKNVNLVFHCAALKHVPICEDVPLEAININVLGTKNVIDACIKNSVDKMILISTDKAVSPINVMGATKLLAEKTILATSAKKRDIKTKFGIVRFGNVLYSRGSVLEIWNRQILNNDKINLTDGEMTRFFMSLSECIDLIFTCTEFAENGELFILKMPSIRMGDFAKAYAEIKGISEDRIRITGLRKGEKMHESLLVGDDHSIVLENERFFINLPVHTDKERVDELRQRGFIESSKKIFSSEDKRFILEIPQIKEILSQEKSLLEKLPQGLEFNNN